MFSGVFVILSFISVFCSNIVGDFVISSNSSASFDDKLLSMIKKQQDLCPYVTLCTARNISKDFLKRFDESIPCCYPCSCEETCTENNTCCPDFHNQLQDTNETEKRSTESLDSQIQCIKVQHGPMENDRGYKMVAGCPNNYTNQTIIFRCESNFDYENIGTLTDHIPVYVRLSGQPYKNKYCFFCNSNDTMTAVFWDIMINCTGGFRPISYSPQSPLDLTKECLKDRNCDILFKIREGAENGQGLRLEECHSNPIISTCKPKYTGTDLEKMCKKYTWHMRRNRWLGYEHFKNYACMLCNDVQFWKECYSMCLSRFYTFSLHADWYDSLSTKVSSSLDTQSDNGQETINRYFPDSVGNSVCQKGFLYHARTNMCRQVICPLYFFVWKGECVPLFDVLAGVGYISHLEIIFRTTFNGINAADIEQAVLFAINKRFQRYLDTDNYMVSLWSNHQTPGNIDLDQKYYLLIHILGQNDYTSFIKFLYWFVVLGSEIPVYVEGYNSVEKYIQFRFSDVAIIERGKPRGSRGENLHLIGPKSWYSKLYAKEEMNPSIQVGKSLFCHRVALNLSEIETNANAVVILERKKIFTFSNVQYEKNVVLACVEDAFVGIPNDSKFIFDDGITKRKNQISNSGNADENLIYKEIEYRHGHTDILSRSLLTTACTVGVIVFFIGIKKCLGKYTRRHQEPSLKCPSISYLSRKVSDESCLNNELYDSVKNEACKNRVIASVSSAKRYQETSFVTGEEDN